jgi:hypothetical protein
MLNHILLSIHISFLEHLLICNNYLRQPFHLLYSLVVNLIVDLIFEINRQIDNRFHIVYLYLWLFLSIWFHHLTIYLYLLNWVSLCIFRSIIYINLYIVSCKKEVFAYYLHLLSKVINTYFSQNLTQKYIMKLS